MDWTTTRIQPLQVYGHHYFKRAKLATVLSVARVSEDLNNRSSSISNKPGLLQRSVFGIGRAAAGSAGFFGSIVATKAWKQEAIDPRVAQAIVATALPVSLYNGFACSFRGMMRNFDLSDAIENFCSNEIAAKDEFSILAIDYGPERAMIALAKVLRDAEWENDFLGNSLGDALLHWLKDSRPADIKKVVRAIGKISAEMDDEHPHLEVIHGILRKLEEKLSLCNASNHLGREM